MQWYISYLIIPCSVGVSHVCGLKCRLNILGREFTDTYLKKIEYIKMNPTEMHCLAPSVPVSSPNHMKEKKAKIQIPIHSRKSSYSYVNLKAGIREKIRRKTSYPFPLLPPNNFTL